MARINQHNMCLTRIHPSGAEEWHCPICSRHIILQGSPFDKYILDAGNECVIHTGCQAATQLQPIPVIAAEEPILSEELWGAIDEVMNHLDFGD